VSASAPDLLRDIERYDPAVDSPPVFDAPETDGHTRYCDRVRPLDDLPRALLRWRHEKRDRVEFRGQLPSDVAQLYAMSRP